MRTLLPLPAIAGIAVALTTVTTVGQNPPRPNVVLVMSDDQGWGDAGYQGHPDLRTPHLDAMARSGVRFDRFYAAAPVCSPTRGSCLTGRHPFRYGIRGANNGHMLSGEHTLAETLRERGYRTGHFGKWHLGTLTTTEKDSNRGRPGETEHHAPPWEHGFDVVFSTEAKVPTFDPMLTPGKPEVPYGTWYWAGPGQKAGDAASQELRGDDSELIMDRALPFIEDSVAEAKPFLAVIWFHAPHLPILADEEHRRPYAALDEATQHYYGCLAALDEQVGRLRAKLRALGVADDTMVWYCSDNGPEGRAGRAPGTAGPLRGRKRSLYEGGVRVPGILEWPGRVREPRVVTAPCSTLDYVPTILAALGVTPRLPVDGIDLWPLVDGRRSERGRALPFESRRTAVWMEDRFKLVQKTPAGGEPTRELYDIAADPGETRDLAAERPRLVAEMAVALEGWRASCARSAAGEDYGTPPKRTGGEAPHQATGFKVGEVTADSAIVWTRLTERATRNPPDAPMVTISVAPREGGGEAPKKVARVEYPEGVTVRDIRNAAPGTTGEVRVSYRPEGVKEWGRSEWLPVDPDRDFTRQVTLRDLRPGTRYRVEVQSRVGKGGPRGDTLSGCFRTAPRRDDARRVVFTVSTGQAYRDRDGEHGFDLYAAMLGIDPDFFVHTGDIVYYDKLAKTEGLARYHWQRTYGLPSNVMFHRRVASYFIKDDHDTWVDDCWPTMQPRSDHDFTFARGVELFPEQVPMGARTYRQRRWGKDLEVWMVEGRDFRSANTDADGPEKSIWGAEQKAWLKETFAASDATFRVLISPTPIVGPDRVRKNDNHANAGFTHEGDEVRKFLASQRNAIVICGDRHWQYHSVHPGVGLREYSCGPASDAHAGGWRRDNVVEGYHRYLRVRGGFLSATVDRAGGPARLTLRFHDTDGEVHHSDVIVAR